MNKGHSYRLAGSIIKTGKPLARRGRNLHLMDFSRKGVLRLIVVTLSALLFFSLVCRPAFINGGSMLPTYSEKGFNFCWKPVFWFGKPFRGQIVIARYAGEDVMLLKRVVALSGDTVEFRKGILYVNGVMAHEPYVKSGCDWVLPLRKVDPGSVYLVGDNRGMPMERHKFGEISVKRLAGVPLW